METKMKLYFWILIQIFIDLIKCQTEFYSLDLDSPYHNSCLMIPKTTIWPFSMQDNPKTSRFSGMPGNAVRACRELGTVF